MNTPSKLAAAMAAALLASTVQGAPKKSVPPPATETKPAPEEVKTKDKPAPAEAAKPAAKTSARKPATQPAPAPAKVTKGKKTPPAPEPAPPPPPPEKKGFFKKLFGSKTPEPAPTPAPAGSPLARVKTAKPAPVKEVKETKEMKGTPKPSRVVETPVAEEPKKKGGFLRFLRGDRDAKETAKVPEAAKIPRPDDWQDHRVVKEDGLALYEFGPSQSNGPDERLDTGAVVKIKRVERGWALVEVTGGRTGYVDAAALRNAVEGDFATPPPKVVASTAAVSPEPWAPAPPPPDLPDQPAKMDGEGGLLLLPPLEQTPKKP